MHLDVASWQYRSTYFALLLKRLDDVAQGPYNQI